MYRPVSLLDTISNVFEKSIFYALYEHVRPLLTDCQSAFRRKRSTTLKSITVYRPVYSKNLAGSASEIEIIYLDFGKAFDKADHLLLLKKLWCIGIRGKLFSIIKSYISDRTQFVKLGGAYHQTSRLPLAFHSGSLLGPLLFLVFINYLLSCITVSTPFLFADDVKLLSIRNTGFNNPQADLDSLGTWATENKMCFGVRNGSLSLYEDNLLPVR